MLEEIGMGSLRAIEQIFILAFFGLGGRGVGIWVGDFGLAAVGGGIEAVVLVEEQ